MGWGESNARDRSKRALHVLGQGSNERLPLSRDLFDTRVRKTVLLDHPAQTEKVGSRRSKSVIHVSEKVGRSKASSSEASDDVQSADAFDGLLKSSELIALARRSVARDLHDYAGQSLVAISMRLAVLEKSADEKLRASLSDLRSMICDFSDELRAICHGETPGFHAEHLMVSLRQLTDEWEETVGIPIILDLDETVFAGLKGQSAEVVFRVVQESLTNVAKHAPQSSHIKICICSDAEYIRVDIQDDGAGGQPPPPATNRQRYRDGISGMRSRVAEVGGQLRVDHVWKQGTRVLALLPQCSPLSSTGRSVVS